jgi:hypothetical protein
VEVRVAREKAAYESALKVGPKYKPGDSVDLDMRVLLVHGDEVISDSQVDGGLTKACEKFKEWIGVTFKADEK